MSKEFKCRNTPDKCYHSQAFIQMHPLYWKFQIPVLTNAEEFSSYRLILSEL